MAKVLKERSMNSLPDSFVLVHLYQKSLKLSDDLGYNLAR